MLLLAAVVAAPAASTPAPATTTTTTTSAPAPAPATTPTVAPAGRRTLVLDLVNNGVDPGVARTLSESVAAAVVRERDLVVTSGADLRQLMDTAATQQSTGCKSEMESCMAEIAGALDAELVVSGAVGVLGDVTVVSVALYDARRQASVGREQVELTDLAGANDVVGAAVARLFGHRDVVVPVVVGVAGAAALVVGAVAAGWGVAVQGDPESAGEAKRAGTYALPAGVVVGVVGAGAVVAAVSFYVVE